MRIARFVLSLAIFGPIGAWLGYFQVFRGQKGTIEGIILGAICGVFLGILAVIMGLLDFIHFKIPIDDGPAQKSEEDDLQKELAFSDRPVVFTEGETDPIYIRTALELLGHDDLLAQLDIRCVGWQTEQGSINTGVTGLNHTRNVIEGHPDLLKQRVLLLYDCDSRKPPEDLGKLFIRAIPNNEGNTKVCIGIENLLPPELFEDSFYERKNLAPSKYGEEKTVWEFRKTDFCNWLCEERRNPDDFQGFRVVVEILQQFLFAKDTEAQFVNMPFPNSQDNQ